MTRIDRVLEQARACIPGSEARLLLSHVLDRSHAWLAAHADEALAAPSAAQFVNLVGRRAEGEPIAYLLGSREFYGRSFSVTHEVLIPRPETELLVDLGIAKIGTRRAATVLDLGVGSGCLAITLALEIPSARVTAAELSPAAVALARRNAEQLEAGVRVIESDWFSALAEQRFDLIVANPPYIADQDPHLGAGDLRFEPGLALSSGPDGLAAIRTIIREAPGHLSSGGWLFIEHGYDQAAAVAALLQAADFRDIEQHRDLAGTLRVSGGRTGVRVSPALDVRGLRP